MRTIWPRRYDTWTNKFPTVAVENPAVLVVNKFPMIWSAEGNGGRKGTYGRKEA